MSAAEGLRALPPFGIDTDRTGSLGPPLAALARRVQGRYPVDPFGGDPQLQDALAPLVEACVRVEVEHPERLPERGAALLVANRGLGILEPAVLATAVRRGAGRRLRIVGAPEAPVVGDLVRKLGAVAAYPADLAAVLRAGHLAAVPLGPTWLRAGAGTPPIGLLRAALDVTVLPVAVRPGGPLGLPLRPFRVRVGRPLARRVPRGSTDPLAAAELGEAARDAVQALLDGADP